jgi:2-polyprenyl-3-methyl-5-hydroxy-6-metoxy-1,4-benzoquinol methylase
MRKDLSTARHLIGPYFEKLESIRDRLAAYLLDHFAPLAAHRSDPKVLRDHIEGRSRFFLNTVLPWVEQFADLERLEFVEFGPGTGSTTAPLAMAAKSVAAYDISEVSAGVARERLRLMGIENAQVTIAKSANLLSDIRRAHGEQKVDAVMMFAVLEHMTVQERIETLRVAWDILRENGVLVIGDTPNRLVYQHGHTSRFPFFDMVPGELMTHYSDRFGNAVLARAMAAWKAAGNTELEIGQRIDRWGRGVSFHEFDIALGGNLEAKVIADGFESIIANPIPVTRIEAHLMRYMNDALPEMPLGFCRAALYLILRKNSRKGKAVKNWDESLVRNLLKM